MNFNSGNDPHSSFSVSQDSTVQTEETKSGNVFSKIALILIYGFSAYGSYYAFNYFIS
jgi:hypothetical protein